MKRKILCTLFALCMIIGLCGALAVTSYAAGCCEVFDTFGDSIGTYSTFGDTVEAALEGYTIKLLKTLNRGDDNKLNKNVTIDLNDYTIKLNSFKLKGENIIFLIKDNTALNNALSIVSDNANNGGVATYTFKLTDNITLDKDITIPESVKIELNDKTITPSTYTLSGSASSAVRFAVDSETDISTLINSVLLKACTKQIWEIDTNIVLTAQKDINIDGTYSVDITIKGIGENITISGSEEETSKDKIKYLLAFYDTAAEGKTPSKLTIENITLKTGTSAANVKARSCFIVQTFKNSTADQNKAAKVTVKNVTFDNTYSYQPTAEKFGTCFCNNCSDITIDADCKFITGEQSYSAIDVTYKADPDIDSEGAWLTFAEKTVTFTDGRTDAKKQTEPLVGFDGAGDHVPVVTGKDKVNLFDSSRGTKTGLDLETIAEVYDNADVLQGKYSDFSEAIAAVKANGKIILKGEASLTKDGNVAANVSIDLNGHTITISEGKTLSGENLTFLVKTEDDMIRLSAKAFATKCDTQKWEIQNDIDLMYDLKIQYLKKLTINGNKYTITGSDDAEKKYDTTSYLVEFWYCKGDTAADAEYSVNNITFKTTDKFRKCILVLSEETGSPKTANVTFENVVFDNETAWLYEKEGKYSYTTCLVNNYGKVTIKGECKFITGVNSYNAIDLTNKHGPVSLTFAEGAKVEFKDGRTVAEKANEPLVGFDKTEAGGEITVVGANNVNLYPTHKGSKDGYDRDVCTHSSLVDYIDTHGNIEKVLIEINGEREYFTLNHNSFGWTIKKYGTNKPEFLYSADNKTLSIAEATDDFRWQYDGKDFYYDATVKVTTRILFFTRTTTSTKRFYLSSFKQGDKLATSGDAVETKVYVNSDHVLQCIHVSGKNYHACKCKNCGMVIRYEDCVDQKGDVSNGNGPDGKCDKCGGSYKATAELKGFDVSVTTKITSYRLADILRGTNKSYVVKIIPLYDEGITVTSVRYKLPGKDWQNGDTFTTSSLLTSVDIEINYDDANGNPQTKSYVFPEVKN